MPWGGRTTVLRLLCTICLLCFSMAPALAQFQAQARVPVQVAANADFGGDGPLRVRLHARDPARLASLLGTQVEQAPVEQGASDDGGLTLTLGRYPQIVAPSGQWLDDSFLVDYRDAAVVALNEVFSSAVGPGTAHARLEPFVAQTLKATSQRGWEVASRVALNRDGDCTEHAVLLVALARANAIPARVALGLVIVGDHDDVRAYGHAWAELQIEGQWTVADAAMFGASVPVHYVPFGVLDDEGPGYLLAVMQMSALLAQRVEVLGR